MIIDSEVHLLHPGWIENLDDEPFVKSALYHHADYELIKDIKSIESVIHYSRANNIERILLMGIAWINNKNNIRNNKYIMECKSLYPSFIDVMLVFNISVHQETEEFFNRLDTSNIKGIKVIGGWQNLSIVDSNLNKFYSGIIEKNLIFMPHINHLTQNDKYDTPQNLFRLARQYPDLKILAPHMGGGLFIYEGDKTNRDILKNVRYITSVSSTMYMTKPAMDICPEKIIFGTDFPYNHCHNQNVQIEYIKSNFSENQQNMIFFENYYEFING